MSTEKNLNNLVINKVENKTVYDYMKSNNLINADELYFVTGADENATETESGLMSAADKAKLNGIQEGAEQNVQADWNVTNVNSDAYIKNKPTTLPADGGDSDTVNGHTVEANVPADAKFTDTVYTHPNYTAKTNGLYKITVDDTGHVSATNAVTKTDITALGIPAQDTTYSAAGTSLGLVKSGGDVTISSGTITVNDDSHSHVISNVDGLQGELDSKVDKVDGKGLSTNDYTTTEKTKLSGIAEGAEVNQNAFSNVVVGSVTVAADSKTDTLTLVAGDNVTLTPDSTNDKITIASKDTVYTHPSYTSKSSGLYKITVDGTGHVSGTTAVVKSDITRLGIPAQDTTYSEATTSAAGLMGASDKAKLSEIGDWTRVKTKPTYTASEVGLGNVDNVKQYSASNPPPYPVTSVNGQTGDVTLTIDPPTDMITVPGGGNAVMGSSLGAAPYVIEFTEDEATVNYVEAPATALVGQIIKVKTVDETGSPIEWEAADMPSEVPVVTTTGDGAAYLATVPDIDTLTAGVSFVMIPHVVSTSTAPTLNVNGLGAKTIRRRLSAIATGVQSGYTASWLAVNIPYRVIYDGTFWIVEGNTKPSASDLYGAVPVDKGGVTTGGVAGQILAKKSDTDYDVEWITPIDVYNKSEVDNIIGNHNQAADNITAGTFAGQVVANSSAQAPETSLLRNSKLVNADTTPTVNGEIFWTYG